MDKCLFCDASSAVLENELAYVRFDGYPVSDGHMLICPRRHFGDFFDATQAERDAVFSLLDEARTLSAKRFNPDGYNIGINCGKAAGQTVMHAHVHVILRFDGDVADPRGGVRWVVPAKATYWNDEVS